MKVSLNPKLVWKILARGISPTSVAGSIIIPIVLVTMIGGIIATTVSTDFMSKTAAQDAERRLDNASTIASEQIGSVLARSLGDAVALSQNPVLRSDEATPTEKLAEMKRVQTFYGTFDDITLVGLDGNVITSTNYKYYGEWDNNILFQSAAHGQATVADETALTDPYTVVVHIASPVVDANYNITSVLLAQMNMEYIWQMIGRTKIEGTGALYLVNESGNIIAGPNGSQLLKKLGFVSEDNGMPPQHELIQYEDEDSTMCAVIASLEPTVPWAGNKWSFVATLSTADAFATVRNVQTLFWIVIMTFLVLFIVVGLVLGRILSSKIKTLARGTAEIAGGNLKYRLPKLRPNELGRLADSFNTMAERLEASTAEISQWNVHLEEQVEAKTKELEKMMAVKVQSERLSAMGYIAASVAHELNDPLTAISGYAQLGMKELGKCQANNGAQTELKTASTYFGNIEKELQRSKNIIRKLISFVRYSKTKNGIVDINQVIGDTLSISSHHLEINKVELTTRLQQDLPPVRGDAHQLQQVFLSMILNAQKAMPQGGKLNVETRHNGQGIKSKVEVLIADTSSGITAEKLERIFEPLSTTTSGGQGAELDLSVSLDIVKQCGGEIRVKSELGVGTMFIISLPVADGTQPRETAPAGNPTRAN